jgi:putative spermidine/putrescine transport system permease protein
MRRLLSVGNVFQGLWSGLVLLFLILPILIIAPISLSSSRQLTFPPPALSLRWYQEVFADPAWLRGFQLSAAIALMTTVLSTALGIAAALALVRGRFPLKKAVYVLILAPMIVPTVISAAAMYFFFATLNMRGSIVAFALGHTVLALPIAAIILSATLQGFDERLEQAALSLGASRMVALRRITLPLVAPGLVSAAVFSFLHSFDDLMVSLFLATPRVQTLPVRIWSSVFYSIEPTVAAVSILLIGLMVVGLGLIQLSRRMPGRTTEGG